MIWNADLKNRSRRKLNPCFTSRVFVLFVEIVLFLAVVMMLLSLDVNKILGIKNHGNKTVFSEITHRFITPQQDYERY